MGSEEEYFKKRDLEKLAKLQQKHGEDASREELEERMKRHYHRCGKCGSSMDTVAFRGIEVEVCPDCGAVLLDKGELQELAGHDRGGLIAALFSGFTGE